MSLSGRAKNAFTVGLQGGMVGFQRKQPVPAFFNDKPKGVTLAVDGVARYQHAGQVQKHRELACGNDFVNAAGHRRLAQHQAPV